MMEMEFREALNLVTHKHKANKPQNLLLLIIICKWSGWSNASLSGFKALGLYTLRVEFHFFFFFGKQLF